MGLTLMQSIHFILRSLKIALDDLGRLSHDGSVPDTYKDAILQPISDHGEAERIQHKRDASGHLHMQSIASQRVRLTLKRMREQSTIDSPVYFHCGDSGHLARSCRNAILCYVCNQFGHRSTQCRAPLVLFPAKLDALLPYESCAKRLDRALWVSWGIQTDPPRLIGGSNGNLRAIHHELPKEGKTMEDEKMPAALEDEENGSSAMTATVTAFDLTEKLSVLTNLQPSLLLTQQDVVNSENESDKDQELSREDINRKAQTFFDKKDRELAETQEARQNEKGKGLMYLEEEEEEEEYVGMTPTRLWETGGFHFTIPPTEVVKMTNVSDCEEEDEKKTIVERGLRQSDRLRVRGGVASIPLKAVLRKEKLFGGGLSCRNMSSMVRRRY